MIFLAAPKVIYLPLANVVDMEIEHIFHTDYYTIFYLVKSTEIQKFLINFKQAYIELVPTVSEGGSVAVYGARVPSGAPSESTKSAFTEPPSSFYIRLQVSVS